MGLLEKFENGRHDRSYELSTIITFLARKDEQVSTTTKLP